MDRSEIVKIVLDAVEDEIVASVGDEWSGGVTEETPLLGDGAPIDSLGLVSVIVQVEERLLSASGVSVSLVDERAMSQRNSPFRTVSALASYASACVRSNDGNV